MYVLSQNRHISWYTTRFYGHFISEGMLCDDCSNRSRRDDKLRMTCSKSVFVDGLVDVLRKRPRFPPRWLNARHHEV